MVRKTLHWVPITALLLAVTWRPSSNYQIALEFVVCTGAVMVVMASLLHFFLFKHEIETHGGADNRSNAASDCKAVSVAVLSATENAAETLMVDTINQETMLIEEGTPVPESLQFESEPWTFFYRAGGIIRELRKASGKQSKYGSEGNMAHSDKVIATIIRATSVACRRTTRTWAPAWSARPSPALCSSCR